LYKIELTDNSKKELDALDRQVKSFVLKSLAEFEANFDAEYEKELIKKGKIKALKGEWSGFYRLRLRTYRVIYAKEADRLIILVVRISHRKDVYE